MTLHSAFWLRLRARTFSVLLLQVGLSLVAVGSVAQAQMSKPATNSLPAGWVSHQDPMGFSLNLPANWTVATDKTTGRINLNGPQNEQVIIWPAWAPQGLDVPTARNMLTTIVGRLGADLRVAAGWGAPEAIGATVVRTVGHSAARSAIVTLAWIPTPKGAAAFLYATAAPEDAYRRDQDNFSRMLQSFHVTGNPNGAPAGQAAAADSQIHYVSWTDPNEGAFTVEVPAGWGVEGGLIRRNALDPRFVMLVKSPDGTITLSGGDAQLPGFVLPAPQWAAVFPEGSWYSPGAGIQWQVRRFSPAVSFGEEYLKLRLPSICTNFVEKDRGDRPDLAQQMDREAAGFRQFGQVTNSAGEIAFTCSQNGQPREGFLLVSTQLIESGVLHIWYAKDLLAYLAPPGRSGEALAILAHIYKSTQVNPQWIARQQQTTMEVSRIATQTQEHVSNAMMESYWNKVKVDDAVSRKRSNEMLGTVDVVDPLTGERKSIENSANFDWINNRGVIVGTNTDSSPGVDFRKLIQLP